MPIFSSNLTIAPAKGAEREPLPLQKVSCERTPSGKRKLGRGGTGSGEMAEGDSVEQPNNANLQGLQEKREFVEGVIDKVMDNFLDSMDNHDLSRFGCAFLVLPDGVCIWGYHGSNATPDVWNRLLSEGLGVHFKIVWVDQKYSDMDIRFVQRGENLFNAMRTAGLNPDWDPNLDNDDDRGEFTVTVVDEVGAKLAVAMALHPRLGSNSRISLVCSLALIPVACRGTN